MINKHYLLLASALLLNACSDGDEDYDFDTSRENFESSVPAAAVFDSASGTIPFPNDVLFGADGTINAPVADPNDIADPAVALNALDGFSTTAPITLPLSRAVTAASVVPGSSVRVFKAVTSAQTGPAVVGIERELTAGTEYVALAVGEQIVVQPTLPLNGNSTYVVVVTNGVTSTLSNGSEGPLGKPTGFALALSDDDYSADPVLGPYQGLVRAMMASLAAADDSLTAANVSMAWSFTTQSINDSLQAVKDASPGVPIIVAPAGLTTAQVVAGAPGYADLYIGTIDLPYYMGTPSADNPAGAITSRWLDADGGEITRFSPMPAVQSTQTVPVLMTMPNATSPAPMPEGGYPIVIFQHGITRDRTNLIGIADALAAAGLAAVAIDMPLHGITDNTSGLYAGNTPFPNDLERTFDMDLMDNATGATGTPDGNIDGSGSYFINLQNLLGSRDAFRQAVADLFVLSNSVTNIVGADGSALPINGGVKSFVGHSLGGIVGSTFLAFDNSIGAATLAMPGSSLPYLLAGSETFGPVINDGLAAAGVATGSADYEQFLLIAQTVVDSGDPANHALTVRANGTPVHMIEVIGDTVVPNAVEGRAFAGTEPLAALMGLQPVTGSTSMGGIVRFTEGTHGSLLTIDTGEPVDEATAATLLAVLQEMQSETASFAASRGTTLPLGEAAANFVQGYTP